MPTNPFLERIQSGNILIADGATGTNLQARGLARGIPPEVWVMENPQEIIRLHQDFIDAGAELILTSTFGGTKYRLQAVDLGDKVAEVNKRAVELAHQATQNTPVLVGGSIGPLGQLMKPYGPLEIYQVVEAYAEQANALTTAGTDLLVIETQFDMIEMKAAIQGVRSTSSLLLVCSFSYDRGKRTMMGISPTQAGQELTELGADVIGINCGKSLDDNLAALYELRHATQQPIWFKPNAGLPKIDSQGNTMYDLTPEEIGEKVSLWLEAGAQVIGGCCGTSPEHLRQIANRAHAWSLPWG